MKNKTLKANTNKSKISKEKSSLEIKISKEKSSLETKINKDLIDDIFNFKKDLTNKSSLDESKAEAHKEPIVNLKLLTDEDKEFFDSRGKLNRSKTEEGYNIYSTEELKIGLGGGTVLCPFDCRCCCIKYNLKILD